MGHITIACYRPRPGKAADLEQLMREHVPMLRKESLTTDREPIIMRAKDGTVVEVFEWTSHEATDAAHTNPAILAMWERFGAACEYVKVSDLAEAHDQWASFEPLRP